MPARATTLRHYWILEFSNKASPDIHPVGAQSFSPTEQHASPKNLYFDIDGTLVSPEHEPKRALANGAFEQAVREAGFTRLVCVSNMGKIIQFLQEIGKVSDGIGMACQLCRGTFRDEAWFRQTTSLATDAEHRTRNVDCSADWWYLDDLASCYLEKDGRPQLSRAIDEKRIFAPDPNGTGEDILDWLRTCSGRLRTA